MKLWLLPSPPSRVSNLALTFHNRAVTTGDQPLADPGTQGTKRTLRLLNSVLLNAFAENIRQSVLYPYLGRLDRLPFGER
jgi:hypothetical protein